MFVGMILACISRNKIIIIGLRTKQNPSSRESVLGFIPELPEILLLSDGSGRELFLHIILDTTIVRPSCCSCIGLRRSQPCCCFLLCLLVEHGLV